MILIIGGSGSGKISALLDLIKHEQSDIDKSYLHVKDPFESNISLVFYITILFLKCLKQ